MRHRRYWWIPKFRMRKGRIYVEIFDSKEGKLYHINLFNFLNVEVRLNKEWYNPCDTKEE